MINFASTRGVWLLVCFGLSGCATSDGAGSTSAHDNMDAVVWLQASTEYAAVTTGIYASAAAGLEEIAQRSRTRSMAVVLDVDETVLDNSPYQGQLVFDNAIYEGESWDRWVAQRAAPAVPGVVDFIRTSQSLGIHVAFITNRTCRTRPGSAEACPQSLDTLVNLQQVGIDTESTTLFLRGERPPGQCVALLTEAERVGGKWTSDKTSRRECVRLDHDIVMLFGDQLGDFTEEHGSASARDVAARFDEWGKSWFMLPNPTYGGWKPRTSDEKRTLMRGTD